MRATNVLSFLNDSIFVDVTREDTTIAEAIIRSNDHRVRFIRNHR